MYEISLVHKYCTHISKHDYSHGVFFEGCVNVVTKEEMDEIVNNFVNTGNFTMFEASDKYMSRQVGDKMSHIDFLNSDIAKNYGKTVYNQCNHCFGKGFTCMDKFKYKYFYWLEVKQV